jgi:hypothetical protein
MRDLGGAIDAVIVDIVSGCARRGLVSPINEAWAMMAIARKRRT